MTPKERMYRLYGKNHDRTCATCCNLIGVIRKKQQTVRCVAYGLDTASNWQPRATACGLYNKPFKQTGLRPVSKPKPLSNEHMTTFFGQQRLEI